MAMRYQVIAACVTNIPAYTSVPGYQGASLATFYRAQILPDGVPKATIRHLLDAGLIAEFEG